GPLVAINGAINTVDSAIICTNAQKDILLQSTIEACYVSKAYQWQVSTDGVSWNDIPGATGDSYLRTARSTGVDMYRLAVAEASKIHISTCRVVSDPYTISVYKSDARTISISGPAGPVCEGNPVVFTADTSVGGRHALLQWQLNGNPAGTDDLSFTSNTLATGDVVNCIFTSSIPCNTPAVSNSIVVAINKKAVSTIDMSVCAGEYYAGY